MSTKPKAKSDAAETVETVARKTQSAAAEAAADTAAKVETAARTASADELSAATRQAYQTWLRSAETLARGFERVNNAMLGYARYAFDANLDVARQLASCASVNEALEIQASHLKASLDSLLAEGSKVNEIATSAIADAYAPLESEIRTRFEKLWKPLAA